jgi:hypothetical protein
VPFGHPGQAPRADVAAGDPVHDVVHEVPDVIQAGQLARAEGGRGLLQLNPGALGRPPVQLLPDHHSAHADVGVPGLVDVTMMAGDAGVADRREPPLLVQLRIVDQDMAAAQDVVQLGDLQATGLQVGDDGRLPRAEPGGGGQQPLAVLPGPGGDLDHQPDPGPFPSGLPGVPGAAARSRVPDRPATAGQRGPGTRAFHPISTAQRQPAQNAAGTGSQGDEAVAVGAVELDDRGQGRDGRRVAGPGVVHQQNRVEEGVAVLSQPDDTLHPVRRS